MKTTQCTVCTRLFLSVQKSVPFSRKSVHFSAFNTLKINLLQKIVELAGDCEAS